MDTDKRPALTASVNTYLVGLMLALLAVGCSRQAREDNAAVEAPQKKVAAVTADEVLKKLIQAYQNADAYSDQALLHLSYSMNGEAYRDSAAIAVRFARPNRAKLDVYQSKVACDGNQFVARIMDDGTNHIDDQWLVRAAPSRLSLNSLLDDGLLSNVINSGLGRLPVQLELLLSDAPLQGFFDTSVSRRLLDDRVIDGVKCFGISVKSAEGEFVLWIDKSDYVLRRFEYPSSVLLANLTPEQTPEEVRLIAEFAGARFESAEESDSAFSIDIPENARQVRYFVKPPQPLPSNLLGQKVGDFEFVNLDGSTWTSSKFLANKIAVLHWYVDHPACQASLEQWENVRQTYKDRDDVVFVAVSVEPSSTSTAVLREVLRRWRVDAHAVRDLNAAGRDVFGIAALPAIVVLDRQQIVQAFEITYNPDLAQQLPTAIDQLLAGEDLAADVLAQLHNDTAEYYHTLAAAGANTNSTTPSAQTVPVHWRMTQLWEAPFHEPGNILLVTPPNEPPRLLVLEEGRIVMQLDENGRSTATHVLPIPESESITHLRAAANGQAFVAFSPGGRRAYWLNADWQLVGAMPELEMNHDSIRDAAFISSQDQDEEEWLLCLATSAGGVLAMNRQGKSVWQCNEPHVQSLTVHQPSGQLIATDASGRLFAIDAGGKEQPIADKQGNGIFRAWSVQSSPGEAGAALLGLSYLPDSSRTMYGLDERCQALWEYQLPGDPFRYPTDFVTSGLTDSSGSAHWVLASADGAIHLLSADGREHDYFFTGDHISGLQVWAFNGKSTLIVGGENSVRAWQIEPLIAPVTTDSDEDRVAPASTILTPIQNAARPK